MTKIATCDVRAQMRDLNDRRYEATQRELQGVLEDRPLADALEGLIAHQLDTGFVPDTADLIRHYVLPGPGGAYALAQTNTLRTSRFGGAGRSSPPAGRSPVNQGCYLCPENITWRSNGTQYGYGINVNGHGYRAYCNPFPLEGKHLTIAGAEHRPQDWREGPEADPASRLAGIVYDMHCLAEQLPGWILFYNGVGVGASIPWHFHFHLIRPQPGHPAFPLQDAARRCAQELASGVHSAIVLDTYPLTAWRTTGPAALACPPVIELASAWHELFPEWAAANIIAANEGGEVALYFVPRNRFLPRAPAMDGMVGGLEALGEIVLSSEQEMAAFAAGRVDYGYVTRSLESVRPHGLDLLLAMEVAGRGAAPAGAGHERAASHVALPI